MYELDNLRGKQLQTKEKVPEATDDQDRDLQHFSTLLLAEN